MRGDNFPLWLRGFWLSPLFLVLFAGAPFVFRAFGHHIFSAVVRACGTSFQEVGDRPVFTVVARVEDGAEHSCFFPAVFAERVVILRTESTAAGHRRSENRRFSMSRIVVIQ